MSFGPASYAIDPPMFLGTMSFPSVGFKYRGVAPTALASNAWPAANRALYTPFYISKPYTLERFWWLNGATVGTDTLQAAIYSVDDSNVMDCVVSTPRTVSAGTINTCQFATCSVVAHGITSGTSTTDGTSFDTASVTLKARPGLMYALIFINSKASAAEAATSVQTVGGAESFTTRVSQTYGASTEGRVSLWTATPSADVTAAIRISFTGTQTGAAWTLVAFTNVDTATNHGIVQTAPGSGNSTTPLATLGAFGSANNATIGANANLADTTTTQGTGFFELYDINYATPTNCLQVQFTSANDTTSDGTITSGQWGAIAAEIKSLGTTYRLSPGRYYLALLGTGTTMNVYSTLTAKNVSHLGVYNEDTLTLGLPLTATPVATANTALINFGITSRASP